MRNPDQETDPLCDKLVLQAELVRSTRSADRRRKLIARLSQTANKIVSPRFNASRLRDAFIGACVERPDFADPVVYDAKSHVLHLNGSFNVYDLGDYFNEVGELIDDDTGNSGK